MCRVFTGNPGQGPKLPLLKLHLSVDPDVIQRTNLPFFRKDLLTTGLDPSGKGRMLSADWGASELHKTLTRPNCLLRSTTDRVSFIQTKINYKEKKTTIHKDKKVKHTKRGKKYTIKIS